MTYTQQTKARKRGEESLLQEYCIDWCRWQGIEWPELDMIFSIPNGGHRHKGTAVVMKKEGVKKGVPDLFFPVSRKGWHGLFVEMKTPTGRVRKDQLEWMEKLTEQGYLVYTIRSLQDFTELLGWYLEKNEKLIYPKRPDRGNKFQFDYLQY